MPEDLSDAEPAVLRALGFSNNKGHAIVNLARFVLDNRVDLEKLRAKGLLENTEGLRCDIL